MQEAVKLHAREEQQVSRGFLYTSICAVLLSSSCGWADVPLTLEEIPFTDNGDPETLVPHRYIIRLKVDADDPFILITGETVEQASQRLLELAQQISWSELFVSDFDQLHGAIGMPRPAVSLTLWFGPGIVNT